MSAGKPGLGRRAAAECLGTALLLAAVVGSGIMGERLSGGNVALALLANTVATGAALVAIILTFGGISGAHLNPAISLVVAWERGLAWREAPARGCRGHRRAAARGGLSRTHWRMNT